MRTKIKDILQGWENFIDKKETTETIAKERAKHCSKCINAKKGMLTVFIKDELKDIQGHYCDLCYCPLSAKLRSINEKCDLNLW